MKELTLNEEKLRAIKDYDIGLEHYIVLFSKYFSLGWLSSYKIRDIVYTHLTNLGYLSTHKSLLSPGKAVIEAVENTWNEGDFREEFQEFWEGWPPKDTCLHFPPSGRNMRGSQHGAFIEYVKLRQDGTSKETLITARDNHIKTLIEESMRVNQNKLKFLPGMSKWLKESQWRNWLETQETPKNRIANVT